MSAIEVKPRISAYQSTARMLSTIRAAPRRHGHAAASREIGFEKPRGDGVTGMAHHRQGRDGQGRLQQHEVIVAKAPGPVRRE